MMLAALAIAAVCSSDAPSWRCGTDRWHTGYAGDGQHATDVPGPHHYELRLGGKRLRKLWYRARQDGGVNGTLRRFRVEIDGVLYAEGDSTAVPGGPAVVLVSGPARPVDRVRLIWLDSRWASAAEVRAETGCKTTRLNPAIALEYPAADRIRGIVLNPGNHRFPVKVEQQQTKDGELVDFRRAEMLDRPRPILKDYDCEPGEELNLSVSVYGDNCESRPTALPPVCCPCVQYVGRETYAQAAARCGI